MVGGPRSGQMTAVLDRITTAQLHPVPHVWTAGTAARAVSHLHLSHLQKLDKIPEERASLPAYLELSWRPTIGDR